MANNTVAEIQVASSAVTGAVFWAPSATALPTNTTTALNVAYKNLGYVGEDGISPNREVSVDEVKDMNGTTLRRVQTDFSTGFEATMLQVTNEDLNNIIYGDANVTVTAAGASVGRIIAIMDKGLVGTMGVIVVETIDGLAKERRVYPVAQVTSMEEGPLVGSAVRQYTITVSAYPDTSGNSLYLYNNDGVFV
jgi:hypothetical protein